MKKKLFIVLGLIIVLIGIYIVYRRISFNNYVDDTIKYSEKINYSTSMVLTINSKISSSKIEYDLVKSYNIRKITINSYKDKNKESSIKKYIVKKGNEEEIYIKDKDDYKKIDSDDGNFYINYKMLKQGKIKSKNNKTYIISMNAYDAYNLIYKKEVMTKKDLDSNIDVTVIMDDKNKFIKEISYKIDNINKSKNDYSKLNYSVSIVNKDINNQNKINLPIK